MHTQNQAIVQFRVPDNLAPTPVDVKWRTPSPWRRGVCSGCRRRPGAVGTLCWTCSQVAQDWRDDQADLCQDGEYA